MTTVIARPGTFLAEIVPVIAPGIFDEEMEIRRIERLILQIMREDQDRRLVEAVAKVDHAEFLRDYASVLLSFPRAEED